MKVVLILAILASACGGIRIRAADSGDQVIVVYNSRLPESKSLADYYAQRRHVPENQIFGFALSTGEEMSRSEFEDSLQKPLAEELQKRKLWHIGSQIVAGTNGQPGRVVWMVQQPKIRYAVLCYGVPVRIAPAPNHKDKDEEKLPQTLRRNEAAVDSELALLPWIEEKPPLAGPLPNSVFMATNFAMFNPTNGLLMVARLDGPSAAIARGLVDKALEAETNGLWGRAYFDARSVTDTNYRAGDEWIEGAADICRQLGFETTLDTNAATFSASFPISQIAIYCGWYDTDVSGPFTREHVEFMPGAFAYHLFSYSAANLRSATENWVGPLLAKGATISMGSVTEPYLAGTPNIAVFVARLIGEGMTFGEAAYASQPVLSWQTTVVGDPLYRPFGKYGPQLHQQLEREHSKWVEWSWLRAADLNLAKGMSPAQVAGFLEQIETTKTSAVLTEKLADLYAELGKPDSAVDTYRKALERDPSPLQRIRLRLTLADKLISASPAGEKTNLQDAMADYEALLRENPDYSDKLSIYQKLLSLAQKLGNKDEIAKYEGEIKRRSEAPTKP